MKQQPLGLLLTALVSAATGFAAYRAWVSLHAPPAPVLAATSRPAESPPGTFAATSSAEAESAPAVPEVVPDLSLPDLEGRRHSLKDYQGRPTVFNFWATWCAPCRREIPLLNTLQREYGSKKLTIVGIAADLEVNVAEFIKTTAFDYPLLVGEREGSEAASRFGLSLVLPFSVFVASDGQVVAVKVGELHREEAIAILTAVQQFDAGMATLPEIRHKIADQLRVLAIERAKAVAADERS